MLRNKRSDTKGLKVLCYYFLAVFCLICIGFIGFHNLDNCVNGMNIQHLTGYELSENNLFRSIDMETCYMEGITMILGSIILLGFIALTFLFSMIYDKGKYDNLGKRK